MLDWKVMEPVTPVPGDSKTGCFWSCAKDGGMYNAARSYTSGTEKCASACTVL